MAGIINALDKGIRNTLADVKNAMRVYADKRIIGSQAIQEKYGIDVSKKVYLFTNREGPAYGNNISDWTRVKSVFRNTKDASVNKTAVGLAGVSGIAGVSAAGRIASGGGLYRDADGNFGIIGIPKI